MYLISKNNFSGGKSPPIGICNPLPSTFTLLDPALGTGSLLWFLWHGALSCVSFYLLFHILIWSNINCVDFLRMFLIHFSYCFCLGLGSFVFSHHSHFSWAHISSSTKIPVWVQQNTQTWILIINILSCITFILNSNIFKLCFFPLHYLIYCWIKMVITFKI